jgi:putative transposase
VETTVRGAQGRPCAASTIAGGRAAPAQRHQARAISLDAGGDQERAADGRQALCPRLQLGQAFENFFTRRARYPTFRKKGVHDRFTLTNDQFTVDGCRIRIPKLGWVRMREPLRFAGKIMSATVSRTASRWQVSVNVDTADTSHLPQTENQGTVGVDLGLSALATLSTGESPIAGPKPHKALLERLRRLSRSLSRKQKGSANRCKAKAKLAKLHARIAAIRADALHKLTTDITRRFHTIGIEDLNVRGMAKNRCLARSMQDMGWFEFRRQLVYKAAMRAQDCGETGLGEAGSQQRICSGMSRFV